jgi:hypothetical protein
MRLRAGCSESGEQRQGTNLGQGDANVLAAINVSVEDTQDVLELGVLENERHSGGEEG